MGFDLNVIMPIVWLALIVVFVVVEFITQGITTIWFAGGSVVALFAAALDASIWVQLILFIAISIVLLFFTRPVLMKHYSKLITKTNVEEVVGETALVMEDISNLESKGKVSVNGMEWSARSVDDNIVIFANEKVVIKKVEGVKLLVERA